MGRRRGHLVLLPERDWLLARIASAPDLTLRQIRAELAARGIAVSLKAIWNFFRAEKLTFKKKACTPPNRAGRTWRASAPAGSGIRAKSTPNGSSSSMKPGSRQT
jgi:transposase